MFFSVIIPVYNVLPYLREAVDSALKQDFKGEYEIILVDDGATDSSGAICDEYAVQEFPENVKIRVIHKPNGGQSTARNAGLDVARGEYIVFLDSDDWLELNALSVLHRCFLDTHVDVIGFPLRKIFSDRSCVIDCAMKCAKDIPIRTRDVIKEEMLPWACCALSYRRDFIEKNGLRFYSGIYHEDILFNACVACLSESIVLLNCCLYNHRQHVNSTMGRTDAQHIEKRLGDMCIVLFQLQLLKKRFGEDNEQAKYIARVSGCIAMDLTDMLAFSHCSSNARTGIVGKLKDENLYPFVYGSSNIRYRFYRGLMLLHLPFPCVRFVYRILPFKHPIWNKLSAIAHPIKIFLQNFRPVSTNSTLQIF
jgi:glycosyltransferase involved in cell wall biosynthesis